jgi:hypothetical protein
MQQTMLVVRVGNDVRFFNNGKVPFACVSVCENQYYKDKETGEKKNCATWITVIGYGPKAEFINDGFVHIEIANQPFGTDFSMPSYIPGLDDEE